MKSFDELFALNQAAAGSLQAVAEPAVPALTQAVADPAAPVAAAVTGAAVIPAAPAVKEGRSLASGWSTQASTVPGRFSYVVNSVHPVPEVFYSLTCVPSTLFFVQSVKIFETYQRIQNI